ncbi:HD-GYP domain-containing protein [Thiolapillus brandeum]|uniref:Two-component response regulator n=1 Tax=Thiolapillus brandeum TaxID=1076588 RepID=A0A7U6GKX3_9GAMM|nr:HD domain-containing phosphohydrolase [Thiolapillus brandeum]BAO45468.1 two-component response regulator [Thiolapillus brandeum]
MQANGSLAANHDILIVDDRPENLRLLESFLVAEGYQVRTAMNGEMALLSMSARVPDLVLLDIRMPGMDGYEVCRQLKSNPDTMGVPIIFVSAQDDTHAKVEAFKSGGVDYISKPFANEEVIARVRTHLQLVEYQHNLEFRIQEGVQEISKLNEELELTQNEMVFTLGALMEKRDIETGKHVQRVAEFSRLLARLYGLDDETVKLIHQAAPFHDVGKVAIPDRILNKPGALFSEEWEIMKTHAIKGYELFRHSHRPVLRMAAIIAKEHHERWDGRGYPYGIQGDNIHVAGRIVILADVFDALTHARSYKEAWSIEKTLAYIQENRGTIFDPAMVDLFLDNLVEFAQIQFELSD